MKLDLLAALNAARAGRRPAAVATTLASGAQRLVTDFDADPLGDAIKAQLASGKSVAVDAPGEGRVFLNLHLPPRRLVIVGAVHISQALAPMAKALDYEVAIVDPRTAFATPERFPDLMLCPKWPDEALRHIGLDPFTAVAALTHDPKIDDPALIAALAAGCFYVGALGSRKTNAARRERLAGSGVAVEAIDRIRGPIGLPIGAATPAEIAVAVIAEITAQRRLAA